MALKFKVSEKDIQKAILDYLRLRGYLCKRNNAGMASYSYKGKNKMFKVGEAGWPDVEGVTKKGQYFGIEVKSSTGSLREAQITIGNQIIANGGLWFVARSVDDVISKGF